MARLEVIEDHECVPCGHRWTTTMTYGEVMEMTRDEGREIRRTRK
jgi:Zn ribbon nucleic-acid-binding protein